MSAKCCFLDDASGSGENSNRWYITVSSDNRLKLWDATTGALVQNYDDQTHLKHPYSAVAGTTANAHSKAKDPSKGVAAFEPAWVLYVHTCVQKCEVCTSRVLT